MSLSTTHKVLSHRQSHQTGSFQIHYFQIRGHLEQTQSSTHDMGKLNIL